MENFLYVKKVQGVEFYTLAGMEAPLIKNFTKNLFGMDGDMLKAVWDKDFGKRGCRCVGACDPATCACKQKSSRQIQNGKLVLDGPGQMPYNVPGDEAICECGDFCSCTKETCGHRLKPVLARNIVIRPVTTDPEHPIKRGAFTTTAIPMGTFLGEARGKVQAKEAPGDCYSYTVQEPGTGVGMIKSRQFVVNPVPTGSWHGFMNHACTPAANVAFLPMYVSGELGVRFALGFVAIRDIEPDEELRFDYEEGWWLRHPNEKCMCAVPDCRFKRGYLPPLPPIPENLAQGPAENGNLAAGPEDEAGNLAAGPLGEIENLAEADGMQMPAGNVEAGPENGAEAGIDVGNLAGPEHPDLPVDLGAEVKQEFPVLEAEESDSGEEPEAGAVVEEGEIPHDIIGQFLGMLGPGIHLMMHEPGPLQLGDQIVIMEDQVEQPGHGEDSESDGAEN